MLSLCLSAAYANVFYILSAAFLYILYTSAIVYNACVYCNNAISFYLCLVLAAGVLPVAATAWPVTRIVLVSLAHMLWQQRLAVNKALDWRLAAAWRRLSACALANDNAMATTATLTRAATRATAP